MSENERARILAKVADMRALSRGAVYAFVHGMTGNGLESLRRAMNVGRCSTAKLTRDRIVHEILTSN